MKRIIFIVIFISQSVLALQNEECDLGFCDKGFSFSPFIPNYYSYVNADRIPGTFDITQLSTDTGKWIIEKWLKNPLKYIRKPLTVHDKKVFKEQNKLIEELNELRKPLGIVYEELKLRKMNIAGVEKIILENNKLKKSRIWLGLRERNQERQENTIKQIRAEIKKIRQSIGGLLGNINILLQNEYAKWAQDNPNLALQLAAKKKMAQLEKRVQKAEAEAASARWDAQIAQANAASAAAEAEAANRRAQEAQERANSAVRRARNLEFKHDMNRGFNMNSAW